MAQTTHCWTILNGIWCQSMRLRMSHWCVRTMGHVVPRMEVGVHDEGDTDRDEQSADTLGAALAQEVPATKCSVFAWMMHTWSTSSIWRPRILHSDLFFYKQKIENSLSTRSPPHDNAASRASRNYAALTEHGPNHPRALQAHSRKKKLPMVCPRGSPHMPVRWKKSNCVERRKTLGTDRDLNQARFCKKVTAVTLHRPATSNAITSKWHRLPLTNS